MTPLLDTADPVVRFRLSSTIKRMSFPIQRPGISPLLLYQWLKTAPRVIQVEDPSAWLWCSFLAGIDSVAKQAREAERGFEEAKRRHEEAERRHEEAERRLKDLKDSLSWKVTRPLRGVEKALCRIRLPTKLSSFLKRSMRV
jgi:hypothetical protein